MGLLNRLGFNRQQRYQTLPDAEDFLMITWDSCRYDTFLQARTPVMDQFGPARRGWAMGTYTLPAHISMFQGILPHVFANEPLYNRFCQQVFRISHRRMSIKPLVTFPEHTQNIMHGFRQRGYFTIGTGAMAWFKDSEALRSGFDEFEFHGPKARLQNEYLMTRIEKQARGRSCFAFVNYGETHAPFEYENMPPPSPKVKEQFTWRQVVNQRPLMETGWTFSEEAYQQQVSCAEFLDARTGELLEFFRRRGRPTTVILCGDHGECFGENGIYGHAIYHEKVMEVPLLIFRLNAEPHAPPVAPE